ncbi:hypothetical protein [Clostridium sp. CF012]|uniref:hypothetical protein n=1 Tax=Clostridium sp. CF012 TaxID=2843319 RepID=UPI0035CB7357
MNQNIKDFIIRSYEREVFQVENNQIIQIQLTNDIERKDLLPRIFEILPTINN